jgi:hypothetical protein
MQDSTIPRKAARLSGEFPASVRQLLWNVDLNSGSVPWIAVCRPIMERGDLAAMRWLLATADAVTLREAFAQLERGLSPRSRALWRCLLDLPECFPGPGEMTYIRPPGCPQ